MNDTTKHTAGPWHRDQYGHIYGTSAPQSMDDPDFAGGVTAQHPYVCTPKNPCDYNLIIASPRLLAALQAIMPFAEALLEGGEHAEYQANRDAVTEARAAIAQALGTDGG